MNRLATRTLILATALCFASQLSHASVAQSPGGTVHAGPCKPGETEVQERIDGPGGTTVSVKCIPQSAAVHEASKGAWSELEATWGGVWTLAEHSVTREWWIDLLLALLSVAVAGLIAVYRARKSQCEFGVPVHNGIGVGAPKIYDARSLSLMMEEMQDQLRRLNSISQQPITDAVGGIQATQSTDLETAINAGGKADAKADAGTSSGVDKSTLAAAPAPTQAKLGERSLDLLSDMVNLTYEVLNLRLILERSLTDRIYEGKPRLQAVLGLPISIDAPGFAVGCCANITVTVTASGGAGEAPSLVAVLPQERTFNTTVARRRSALASAGGPFKGLTFGLQGRSSSDESSLDRDSDLVAVLAKSDAPSQTRFGWQLRPTSSSRSIPSGMRQLFAVLALPQKDEGEDDKQSISIEVKTSWRAFNRKTATSSDGVNWRAWLSERPVDQVHTWEKKIEVCSTLPVENNLAPQITHVEYQPVAANRAVMMVRGNNFFPGTTIILGDKDYKSPEDGLVIKSEKTLQLTAPREAFLNDAVLNGRYGPSKPLYLTPDPKTLPKLAMGSMTVQKPDGSKVARIELVFNAATELSHDDWERFLKLPDPLFKLGDALVDSQLIFSSPADASKKHTQIVCKTIVDSELVPSDSCSLLLKFPLLGPEWSFTNDFFYPLVNPTVTVAKREPNEVGIMIAAQSGVGFVDEWEVILDKKYTYKDPEFTLLKFNLLQLIVPKAVADRFDTLIIIPPNGPAIIRQLQKPGSPEVSTTAPAS